MAVALTDIPVIILERIEAAHPGPALFSAAEIDGWPEGSLDHLRECGVLQPAQRADAVVCPGCSWQCHKPVVVRNVVPGVGRRAFVVCNEEPDYGRQAIDLRSLDQYRATIDGLCVFLAGQMGLGPPRSSPAAASFHGAIKGRNGLRQVSVGFSAGRLLLEVGQQSVSVARILCWAGARLTMDIAHLRRLADRKEPPRRPRTTRLPDRTRQRERSRQMQVRNEAIFGEAKRRADKGERWTAIADAIAATDLSKVGQRHRVSAATVRRIIAEMLRRERENSRSNRQDCR